MTHATHTLPPTNTVSLILPADVFHLDRCQSLHGLFPSTRNLCQGQGRDFLSIIPPPSVHPAVFGGGGLGAGGEGLGQWRRLMRQLPLAPTSTHPPPMLTAHGNATLTIDRLSADFLSAVPCADSV